MKIRKENLCLALVGIVIGTLFLEAGTRLWDNVDVFEIENYVNRDMDLIRRNTGAVDFDTGVGWRLRENTYSKGSGTTVGAQGVRMNENKIIQLRKGGILAVGDSFTAGSGVKDNETWPARLEQMTGTPVINGSAGGWAVDQMILFGERLIPIVKPKTLIVSILSQDSLRNSFKLYGGGYKPYFLIENGKAVLKGQPTPRVKQRPMELGWKRGIFGYSYLVHFLIKNLGLTQRWIDLGRSYIRVSSEKDGVKISCLLMERLVQLKEKLGIRIIVMVQYGGAESEGSPPPWYGPPVLKCAKEHRLETIDTYPHLHRVSKQNREKFVKLWFNEGGQLGHMTAEGNLFIANILHSALIKNNVPKLVQ